MATFDELVRKTKMISARIAEQTGVSQHVATNVLHYAKSLTPPSNPEIIDEIVFVAQMGLRFGITSRYHLQLMFEALREPRTTGILLEEYVKTVCTFLSNNLDVKIDFVYRSYNFNKTGYISTSDITQMLKTCIIQNFGEEDPNEQTKELVEIVMGIVDTNTDGYISIDEFRNFVKKDILCLELFGKILPSEKTLKSFRNLVSYMSAVKIKEYFASERKACLGEPPMVQSNMKDLFKGVMLDLP